VDSYVRQAVSHEWCATGPDGCCVPVLDTEGGELVVEVTRLSAGARVRRPFRPVVERIEQ
jgi:hypothetical protein